MKSSNSQAQFDGGVAEQVKKASTIKMHTRFVGFVVRSMAHPPPAHPPPPLLVCGMVSSRLALVTDSPSDENGDEYILVTHSLRVFWESTEMAVEHRDNDRSWWLRGGGYWGWHSRHRVAWRTQ